MWKFVFVFLFLVIGSALLITGCSSAPYQAHGPNFSLKNKTDIQAEIERFTIEYGYFKGHRLGGKKYEEESIQQLIERVSPEAYRVYLLEGPRAGVNSYNRFLRQQFSSSPSQ
jgi:hypothetical protein